MVSESDKVILLALKFANRKISPTELQELEALVKSSGELKRTCLETLSITQYQQLSRPAQKNKLLDFFKNQFHVKRGEK